MKKKIHGAGAAHCKHDSGLKGGDGKIVYEWQEYVIDDANKIIELSGENFSDFDKVADLCAFAPVTAPTCPAGYTVDPFTNNRVPPSPTCASGEQEVGGVCTCINPDPNGPGCSV